MALCKVNRTKASCWLALGQARPQPRRRTEAIRAAAAGYHQKVPTYATLRLKTTTAMAAAPPSSDPTLVGHGRTLQQKFYENRILDRYTAQEPKKVTLRQLVLFGRQLTDDKLVASANYVRTELPVRLAHRISDFQFLPYIAGTNPHLRKVYDLYWRAFDEFRKFPVVKTLDDNRRFCDNVKKNLLEHSQVIPQLGMGVSECADLVAPEEIDRFMNQMLISRISRRTLAEQHIKLSEQFDDDLRAHLGPMQSTEGFAQMRQAPRGFATQRIGIVRADCNAAQIVHESAHQVAGIYEDAYHLPPGTAPQVIVEGHTDATFMCIPAHFSYIVHELLKNAMAHVVRRFAATLDTSHGSLTDPVFPPIRVTICSSHSDIVVRVSDQGGGIGPDVLPYVWSFTHPLKARGLHNFHAVHRMEARVDEADAVSPLMSFGFGLPMSRVYARYWGGSVGVHSLPGHGVDAYIQLPRLGNVVENISARHTHVFSPAAAR
ncbi:[Pyruvate dehydrogenase (acetyl-transferring)] kinase 2, mitochondrial [Coemansia sp. RSA 2559]|nr:[Pyruvate dehydrogenase (acetyl-transferring)] kinase 2, mitochondrial [Coemansia sp. RSA 2559]